MYVLYGTNAGCQLRYKKVVGINFCLCASKKEASLLLSSDSLLQGSKTPGFGGFIGFFWTSRKKQVK